MLASLRSCRNSACLTFGGYAHSKVGHRLRGKCCWRLWGAERNDLRLERWGAAQDGAYACPIPLSCSRALPRAPASSPCAARWEYNSGLVIAQCFQRQVEGPEARRRLLKPNRGDRAGFIENKSDVAPSPIKRNEHVHCSITGKACGGDDSTICPKLLVHSAPCAPHSGRGYFASFHSWSEFVSYRFKLVAAHQCHQIAPHFFEDWIIRRLLGHCSHRIFLHVLDER